MVESHSDDYTMNYTMEQAWEARLYINSKVKEMKDAYENATEEAKEWLRKTFKQEIIDTPEYQEKLAIVKDVARRFTGTYKDLSRLLISDAIENFRNLTEEYYWILKTYLTKEEFDEFENSDIENKLSFLCKRFWWWDESFRMMLCTVLQDYRNFYNWKVNIEYARDAFMKIVWWMIEAWWAEEWEKFSDLTFDSFNETKKLESICIDDKHDKHLDSSDLTPLKIWILSNPSYFSADVDREFLVQQLVFWVRQLFYYSGSYWYKNANDFFKKYFWNGPIIDNYEEYHNILVRELLDADFEIDFKNTVLKHIDKFTWLTSEEKESFKQEFSSPKKSFNVKNLFSKKPIWE